MHPEFILSLACAIRAKSYLELGLYEGETFLLVENVVDCAVGVDMKPRFMPRRNPLFVGTTDEFFAVNRQKFDLIFIDADHCFDSAKSDLCNSIQILNPFGLIVMHDTDPTREDLLDKGYCGDSYRVIDWIIDTREDLNVITLPVSQEGLSIIQRKGDRRVNSFLL